MTDHLEPYRRMVRSMRFSPAVSLTQPSPQSVAQPVIPVPGIDSSLKKTIPEPEVKPAPSPPVDPSERVAALVQEAVSKPTVLPVTYSIPENIGDRISRLTTRKPVNPKPNPVILLPKIPQPDVNGMSAHPIEPQPIQPDEKKLAQESRAQAPAPTTVVEPPTVKETPDNEAVALVAEPVAVEQTAETQAPEVVAQPLAAEETPSEEQVAVVAQPAEVEQTPDEQVAAIAEPVTVEDTPSQEQVAVVAEPVTVEDTPSQEQVAVVAEPSEVEQTPDEQAAAIAEPVTVEDTADDALTDEAATASASSLLDKVSDALKAVVTSLTNANADTKNSDAAAESTATADENGVDSQTIEITCPECQSPDIRKNGRRQGKQRYICKDCGRQFVTSDAATLEDNSEIKSSSKDKTSKVKASQMGAGVSDKIAGSSKGRSKKKAKPKGFGSSKAN